MTARGMAMVEALVASALLGLGLLGATRLVTHALSAALQTRQEVQAQALAGEALGCAMARTEPCPLAATVQHQGVGYTVQLQRSPLGTALSEVQAQVQWRSSPGAAPRSIVWRTRVSALPDVTDALGVSSPACLPPNCP